MIHSKMSDSVGWWPGAPIVLWGLDSSIHSRTFSYESLMVLLPNVWLCSDTFIRAIVDINVKYPAVSSFPQFRCPRRAGRDDDGMGIMRLGRPI